MAIKLITGLRETQDIQSEDDGARIYGTISSEDRVLAVGEKLAYQVISNDCVRIKSGEILMQGRHIRQAPGTYTDLTIDNGTQGQNRNDLIVLRYTKKSDTNIENAELAVIKGTSAELAVDPGITTGNIFEGCLVHEMPLYRVSISGLSIISVTALFMTFESLENRKVSKLYTATIGTDWLGSSAPYTQNVIVAGLSSNDVPIVDVVLSATPETAQNQLEAWACISKIETGTDQITVTCLEEKPIISIPIQLEVVK